MKPIDLSKIRSVADFMKVNWNLYTAKANPDFYFHVNHVENIKYPVREVDLNRVCALSVDTPCPMYNTMGELWMCSRRYSSRVR